MNILIFTVAGKEYGVDIKWVRQVIRMREAISIPESAPFVKGVISLRSKVIPLVSLRKLLGIEKESQGAPGRIIITQIEGHLLGAEVDKANEVMVVEPASITAPDDCLKDAQYLAGVIKAGERLILIVDMEKFFGPQEKVNIQELHARVEVRKAGKDG
jgi:purine-binding chemotaxis protein CheW